MSSRVGEMLNYAIQLGMTQQVSVSIRDGATQLRVTSTSYRESVLRVCRLSDANAFGITKVTSLAKTSGAIKRAS
jgi:hypothetical protein